MQAPGSLDLTIYQGATYTQTLTWKIDGDPVDLTTYTARMQARTTYDAPPTLNLATGSGITLGGAAGTITISITAANTATLPAGRYLYDLEMVNGSTVTRLLAGRLTISPEVTR